MSTPLRDIPNDRDTSPPRSARLRPQLHLVTNPALGPGPLSAARSPYQPEPVSASGSQPLSAGFHPDGSRAPRPLPAARPRRRGFRNLLPGNLAARLGTREQPMEIDQDDDDGGTRGYGQIHGSQFHGPQAHGSQVHGPQVHGPQRGGSQVYDPRIHNPQNYGPQGSSHQDHGSQIYGSQRQERGLRAQAPQTYGPQAHGSQEHGRQGYGPQDFSSQVNDPQYGPQVHGSQGRGPQLHGLQSYGSQERARQAQGRQGYGPQGFSSQANNPQHSSQVHGPQGYNPQSSDPQIHYGQRTQAPPHPAPSNQPIPGQNHPTHPPHSRPFPGIFNALLNHPELIINLSSHLTLPTLTSLYAISRTFHYTVNQRFTALMRAHADLHAPESRIAFPHHCYPRFCRPDPAARINEINPREIRATPTLRWLGMVLFRETVVDEILALLQKEGLNMPSKMSSTMKKIWFVMDMSVNALRVGILRNTEVWGNDDLYRATEFLIKLAMRFTDPKTGSGSHALRNLVMAQKSLSTLWRVLKREELRSQLEVLRMEVRTFYIPPRHAHLPILGVPPKKVGRLQYEGYGKIPNTGFKLIQIHELVMKEGIRRELGLQGWYLDMAMSGFVDKTKGQEWKDVWGQEEVEVEEVEVYSEESETESGSDTEWESEEEYFREGSSEDEEEDEDEEMVDAVADDERERVVRRRRRAKEREGVKVKKEAFGGLPGNFAFDDNDPDLREARERHRAYLASVQQGVQQRRQ